MSCWLGDRREAQRESSGKLLAVLLGVEREREGAVALDGAFYRAASRPGYAVQCMGWVRAR